MRDAEENALENLENAAKKKFGNFRLLNNLPYNVLEVFLLNYLRPMDIYLLYEAYRGKPHAFNLKFLAKLDDGENGTGFWKRAVKRLFSGLIHYRPQGVQTGQEWRLYDTVLSR